MTVCHPSQKAYSRESKWQVWGGDGNEEEQLVPVWPLNTAGIRMEALPTVGSGTTMWPSYTAPEHVRKGHHRHTCAHGYRSTIPNPRKWGQPRSPPKEERRMAAHLRTLWSFIRLATGKERKLNKATHPTKTWCNHVLSYRWTLTSRVVCLQIRGCKDKNRLRHQIGVYESGRGRRCQEGSKSHVWHDSGNEAGVARGREEEGGRRRGKGI